MDTTGKTWMDEVAEEKIKSEPPQLTEIAATILTGLLASGDYTEGAEHFRSYDKKTGPPRAFPRPEAVDDAIALARQLVEKTRLVAVRLEPQKSPPPAQE
jgi:hypothetical protein